MTTDDHLTDLLAERAEPGEPGPPHDATASSDAIARRARRRHRQRLVGTGLAALCVVAGIVGGFALAGGDDEAQVDPVDAPACPLCPCSAST